MPMWLWLAGGLLLVGLELVTPSGFFLLFFGLGALTVGALAALGVADTAGLQWLLFTAFSLVYLLIFRRRLGGRTSAPPPEVDSLVGALAVPRETIQPGAVGRVELRGAVWTARNEAARSLEPGERCRVVKVDGLLLGVQPE